MKPPWFFCCGWWSPWCVLDEYGHRLAGHKPDVDDGSIDNLPRPFGFICRKHDQAMWRHHTKTQK